MSKRKFLSVLIAFALAFQLFSVAACAKTPSGTDTSSGSSVTDSSGMDGETKTTDARYRLSYYTGCGATIDPVIGVKAGTAISAPEDPKWAFHTFEGWYLDPDGVEPFAFDKMPAKNLVLYAKWSLSVEEDVLINYQKELAETSQAGHLYIHYLRFNNDPDEYAAWDVWSWPYQLVGRTFDWNRSGGELIYDSIAGVTCDIDLTKVYQDAGKYVYDANGNVITEPTEETQFLSDEGLALVKEGRVKDVFTNDPEKFDMKNFSSKKIGFLIVKSETKKQTGHHWSSDGNADQFIVLDETRNDDNPIWDNGSIHVFCVQDNISSFTYTLAKQGTIVNPYADDDGSHVSKYNVLSSQTLKVNNGTSLTDTVSGVGYQIMVSSFADSDGDGVGDIRGIIENFEYIKKLNVNVLWLTPIQLSDSYHGYDIIDYKKVDPKFGTLDDYKELIGLCHKNGIKIIMDLVLNHTSTNNVWFQNSVKMVVEDGVDYRNFYQWRNNVKEPDLSEAWYQYSDYNYSYYAKFSPSMPELNYDNQATRDAIVDVAKYWLGIMGDKTGVDGFRIDAVKHIYMEDEIEPAKGDVIIEDYDKETKVYYNSNLTKNINFFTEFSNRIKEEYPNAYLVGENFDGHAYNVAPYYAAYDGMLNFYMYYQFGQISSAAQGDAFTAANIAGANSVSDKSQPRGKNTSLLKGGQWNYKGVYDTQSAYRKDGLVYNLGSDSSSIMDSLFTSNHDIPRLMNNVIGFDVFVEDNPVWKGGTLTADNSQIAQSYAKATIATMMTMPGISWIYYGDEIGMSSNYYNGENELSPHADRAYRQPFKWVNDENGEYITDFSISGDTTLYVNWDDYNKNVLKSVAEQDEDDSSYLNEVRYWTNIKSTDEVLRYGDYYYYTAFTNKWHDGGQKFFAFTRTYGEKQYLVVTNFSGYDCDKLKQVIGEGKTLKYKTGGTENNDYDTLAAYATMVVEL